MKPTTASVATPPRVAEALAVEVVRVLAGRFDLLDALMTQFMAENAHDRRKSNEWAGFRARLFEEPKHHLIPSRARPRRRPGRTYMRGGATPPAPAIPTPIPEASTIASGRPFPPPTPSTRSNA